MTADPALQETKERLIAFAEGFAAASGLEVEVSVTRDDRDGMTIAFNGPDARYLVGSQGRVLDALQAVAASLRGRKAAPRMHVLFEADGYREKREKMLMQMALELADEVEESGQEAELEPLSSMERRIIHNALQERPAVRTYSEGEEPNRYIVIAPAS